MKCNSKILISHQIFYCMFSISTCNLKNLIFLNHETFMLASSSDSSYKACMRHACVQKSTWKIQNAIPKPKFLSQAINFMINSSSQRERERERERERGTWKGAKRARFDEQIEIPGACLAYFRFSNHTQSFESERKLKRKEENQREKRKQ